MTLNCAVQYMTLW